MWERYGQARASRSVDWSMLDVLALARHSSLQMTQRYMEVSADAMNKVVGWALMNDPNLL